MPALCMKAMPDAYQDSASDRRIEQKRNAHNLARPSLHACAVYGAFNLYEAHQVTAPTMFQYDVKHLAVIPEP